MDIRFTYEDYVRIPQDGRIHEIIEGVHYNHPAPRVKHQRISRNLERIFLPYITEKKPGEWFDAPIDVVLSKYDIVQPDKVFISKKREGIITDLNIQGAPDIIIEITSPSDADYDRQTKMKSYARYGVEFYIIVDSQLDFVEVYRHTGGGFELSGKYRRGERFEIPIFPELEISVSDIFEGT
jgi:Uma2 family endonuclease